MTDDLRFVTARPSKANPKYWYWQRAGYDLTRLPNDYAARARMAARLNHMADAADADKSQQTAPPGTVSWVIATYKASPEYGKLAQGSLKYYRRFLADIEDVYGDLPFSALSRKVVVDFVHSYEAKSAPRQCACVMRNLFNVAMYHGYAEYNHATQLRLATGKARDQVWGEDAVARWLEACEQDARAEPMRMAFLLMLFTAQRPGDCLAMGWPQWHGDTIKLRQQKTSKLVEVPAHPVLQAALSVASERKDCIAIVSNQGRRMTYTRFLERFNSIKTMAGIEDLQPRDIRRTAMVNMAEGGATDVQIAAVSGHSIESTRRILETYVPRTVAMARQAVDRMRDLSSLNSGPK